jgi:hypothetical protein
MRLRDPDVRQAAPAPASPPGVAAAFGLDVELGLPVEGLAPGETAGTGRTVSLERADPAQVAAGWDSEDTVRLREWYHEDGRVEAALERHPELGFRLFADGYGAYAISPGGTAIRCAPPPEVEGWRWQRCLVGQVLSLAVVLQGLEVFHAAAVAVDGRAVGLVGASTAGKSSVAVHLVLRGAELLADDVLALDPGGARLEVHPGPGVMSVRHAEARRLADSDLARLGTLLGDDGEALRVRVPRATRAVPLAALYFLDRSDAKRTTFEPVWPPDPRLLLGSTFNHMVVTPERLTNQLEVCTRLAHSTPLFRARVATDTGAAGLAAALETHLREHP